MNTVIKYLLLLAAGFVLVAFVVHAFATRKPDPMAAARAAKAAKRAADMKAGTYVNPDLPVEEPIETEEANGNEEKD